MVGRAEEGVGPPGDVGKGVAEHESVDVCNDHLETPAERLVDLVRGRVRVGEVQP